MNDSQFASILEDAFSEAERLIGEINRPSRFSHPFRDRFEHTKRVLRWAERIQQVEGGDLDIITLAVLFHDSGWRDGEDHALIGAELAEKFLLEKGLEQPFIEQVAWAARTHNKRLDSSEGLPIENLIVMDADILDELGVTTLVWDSMATALEEEPSFLKALEKSQHFLEWAISKQDQLKTQTGKKLYAERIAVWEESLAQLRYELGVDE